MWKAFYTGNDLVPFALFALLFFVAFFTAVVLGVALKRRDSRFESLATLPLADDTERSDR